MLRLSLVIVLAFVAVTAGMYGVFLLATLGDEFEPRGSVGIAAVLIAVVAATIAYALTRDHHRAGA